MHRLTLSDSDMTSYFQDAEKCCQLVNANTPSAGAYAAALASSWCIVHWYLLCVEREVKLYSVSLLPLTFTSFRGRVRLELCSASSSKARMWEWYQEVLTAGVISWRWLISRKLAGWMQCCLFHFLDHADASSTPLPHQLAQCQPLYRARLN